MGPKAAHVVVFNREKGLLEEEKIHPVPPPPPLPPSLVRQPQGAGPAPLRRRGVERCVERGERGGCAADWPTARGAGRRPCPRLWCRAAAGQRSKAFDWSKVKGPAFDWSKIKSV